MAIRPTFLAAALLLAAAANSTPPAHCATRADDRESIVATLPEINVAKVGEPFSLSIGLLYYVDEPLESLLCSWELDGFKGAETKTFSDKDVVEGVYQMRLNLPAVDVIGERKFSMKILKVNGVDQKEPIIIEAPVYVVKNVPVNRPFVEEYTSFNCGWCPEAYVALENMKESYPEDFVAVSWHESDQISLPIDPKPRSTRGWPEIYINRNEYIERISKVYEDWPDIAACPAYISVDVKAGFADDTWSTVVAEATFGTIHPLKDVDYKVGFMLVEDGMSSDKWVQSNSYFNHETILPGPLGDFFHTAGYAVRGLVYNDIVVYAADWMGIDKSFPSELEAFEETSCRYSIDLDKVVSDKNESLVLSKDALRVVAFLIDEEGRIINSNTSGYTNAVLDIPLTGVSAAFAGDDVISSEYYDLQGCRIDSAAEGVKIRIDRYGNGAVKASKVLN